MLRASATLSAVARLLVALALALPPALAGAQDSARATPDSAAASAPAAFAGPDAVLEAFTRAVESRSIADMRRVHPGLTAAEERRWTEQIFPSAARDLRMSMRVARRDVSDAWAVLRLLTTVSYRDRYGARQAIALNQTARIRRDPDGWRLAALEGGGRE